MTASPQTTDSLKLAMELNPPVVSLSDSDWLRISLATPLDDRSKALRKQIIRVL